jgi:hypothetical protein
MSRARSVHRRSGAVFVWRIVLLASICILAVPALASEKFHSTVGTHLARPGTPAVADLDGDHVVDLASGTKTGRSEQGYVYRVDLDLSSNPDAKFFIIYSDEPAGLNIQAIDIDGDHDLDLVVATHLGRQPVGVWLNDGKGGFIRDDSSKYDPSVWQRDWSIRCRKTNPIPVSSFEARRPEVTFRLRRINLRGAQHFFSQTFTSQSGDLVSIPIASARFRAPPLQQSSS